MIKAKTKCYTDDQLLYIFQTCNNLNCNANTNGVLMNHCSGRDDLLDVAVLVVFQMVRYTPAGADVEADCDHDKTCTGVDLGDDIAVQGDRSATRFCLIVEWRRIGMPLGLILI